MTNLNLSHPEHTSRLANMWNRGHGANLLALEIERAQQESGYRFSILLVELDDLSRATDRLGRVSTDDVWRRVLGVLTESLGAKDLCCRVGEDEFMLILPEKTRSECRFFGERLRRRWTSARGALEAALEVSIGIASYPAQGTTVERLFGAVDEAVCTDKRRNQSGRYAPRSPHALPTFHRLSA